MSNRTPEELLPRHEAFVNRLPLGRPLLGFWRGGYYPAEQYPHGVAGWAAGQPLKPADLRFERFREDYERLYRLHQSPRDDFFFVGSAYWGIPWMEAILSCPIFAGNETAWSKPLAGAPERCEEPVLDPGRNAWLDALVEFTEALLSFSAGRFPVCAPLLRGPGDCAAALLGMESFICGLMDDPESTRRLLDRCSRARTAVIERLQNILPPWHGTYAAGGYPSKLWCGRRTAYHQEDSAALLNPKLFKEFLLPLHRSATKVAEVNFIHLHSACLYPVDLLIEDGCFDVLEINLDHKGAGPGVETLAPVLRNVQERNVPLLLWGHLEFSEWDFLLKRLKPSGLSVQPAVGDERELKALEELFERDDS